MKIVVTVKLGVVGGNKSVLVLMPFLLEKLKSKTPTHCGDTYSFLCFFVRGWPPPAEN